MKCVPVSEFKVIYGGYKQNFACDSLLRVAEKENKKLEERNSFVQETNDSLRVDNKGKDEIIEMGDHKDKKHKREKFGIGLGAVVLIVLSIIF